MKSVWKVWLASAMLLMTSLVLVNCQGGEDRAQFDQQRNQVRTRIQASINRIDSTIAMLEDRKERGSDMADDNDAAEEAVESRNQQIDVRITALRERKEILEQRIDSLETVSEERWDLYQSDVDRTLGDVDTELRNYDADDEGMRDTTMMGTDTVGRQGTGTGTGGR